MNQQNYWFNGNLIIDKIGHSNEGNYNDGLVEDWWKKKTYLVCVQKALPIKLL